MLREREERSQVQQSATSAAREEKLRRQRDREREPVALPRNPARSKVGVKTSILAVGSPAKIVFLSNVRVRRQRDRRCTQAAEKRDAILQQRRQPLVDETAKEREAWL